MIKIKLCQVIPKTIKANWIIFRLGYTSMKFKLDDIQNITIYCQDNYT